MKTLCFDGFGGPEFLQLRDLPAPALKPEHALVRVKAIGLNFADVYRRKGNYHLDGKPPYVAGYEGAGVVESSSGEAGGVKPGDRVSRAEELFGWVRSSRLRVRVAARFALSEGAAAHAFLESRRSIGKVLLLP